jgi:hypothetical protein
MAQKNKIDFIIVVFQIKPNPLLHQRQSSTDHDPYHCEEIHNVITYLKIGTMKKGLHDLIYHISIDPDKATFTRDEPGITHHEERLIRQQNQSQEDWLKLVAHKIRYASEVHIKGQKPVTNQLQALLESDPHNTNIAITREELVM